MIHTIRPLTLALLFSGIMAVLPQQTSENGNENAKFSLTISTTSTVVKAADHIVITVKLRNTSNLVYLLPVRVVYMRADLDGFVPEVWDKDGAAVPPVHGPEERRRNYGMTEAGIQPGRDFGEKLDLSKVFNLTTPGTYLIRIHKVDRKTNVTVYSNSLSLTVAPQ